MDEENIDHFIDTFTDGYSLHYFKEMCCIFTYPEVILQHS